MAVVRSRGFVVVACLLVLCGAFVLANLETSVTTDAPVNGSVVGGNASVNLTLPGDAVNLTLTVTNGTETWLLNGTNLISGAFNITWQTRNGSFYDGRYNLTLLVFNATNVSDNLTLAIGNITVDNTPPALALLGPSAGLNTSNTTINLTWSVNDTVTISISCAVYLNGTLNDTIIGNETQNLTRTLADGPWNWSVTCTDGVGNANASAVRAFRVDTRAPAVGTVSTNATRNATKANATITITVNVTDLTALRVNISNATVRPMAFLSGNLYRYTGNATDLGCPANGTCVLTVNATDALWYENASITFNLTIDDITPNITAIGDSGIDSNEGTISATTDEPVIFTLRYGTAADDLDTVNTTISYATGYSQNLEGLDAGTIYYYNLTVCDAAGNCVTNGTRSFTTSALSSGGGGGGGGGGGYAAASTTVEAKYGRVWGSVPKGPFSYEPKGVAFSDIGFTLNGSINRLKIDVIQHKERPTSIVPLTGPLIYRYIEIVHEGIQGASGYHVTFRVPNDWLASNGVGPDIIKLYRLETGGVWTAYAATPGEAINGSLEFTAELPGFSAFAIAANPSAPAPVTTPTPEETETAQEETTPTQQPPTENVPSAPSTASPSPIIATTGEKGSGVPRVILMILGVIGVFTAIGVVAVHQRRVAHEQSSIHERELAQERERLSKERLQKRATLDARDTAAKEAEVAYAASSQHRPAAVAPVIITVAQPTAVPATAAPTSTLTGATPVMSAAKDADHPLTRHPAYHAHIAPLREYIRKARDRGLSDAHVAQRLLEAGWNTQIIEHELGTAPKGNA